jgi:hypothetical protein
MQADLEAFLRENGLPSFGAREIGKFVSDAFVEDRTQIKLVIEAQLRLVRGVSPGQYANIDLPLLSSMTVASGTPSGVLLSARLERPTLVEGLRSASGVQTHVAKREPAKARRSPVGMVVLGLGLAAVAAGGIALSLRRPADVPLQAPPSGVTASTPVATAPVTTASTPAVASGSPRDAVDAGVSAAPDVPIGSTLRPTSPVRPVVRPQTAPTAGPIAPTSSSAPAPTPQPTSTTRVRQQIDTSNPYGH